MGRNGQSAPEQILLVQTLTVNFPRVIYLPLFFVQGNVRHERALIDLRLIQAPTAEPGHELQC